MNSFCFFILIPVINIYIDNLLELDLSSNRCGRKKERGERERERGILGVMGIREVKTT